MLSHTSTAFSRTLWLQSLLSSVAVVALIGGLGVYAYAYAYAYANQPNPSSFLLPLTGAGLALLGIIWFSGAWVRRSALSSLGQTLGRMQSVARGELVAAGNESNLKQWGSLDQANQATATVVETLGQQVLEMRNRHDQGEISYRLDEKAFPGAYGKMATDLNAMVAQHIGVKMRAVEVMRHYAVGDLSVDMDRLPGEKGVITDAMDRCKASLLGINAEAKRLASAAAAGDFSLRGDESLFKHDFLVLVQSLNAMMATSDTNLAKLSTLLKALAQGDLRSQMEGDYHGVFGSMRDDSNRSMAQLTAIVRRIQDASSSIQTAADEIAAGNSELSRRTEQQAVSLEETAASMEELTITVKQNADHASKANRLALEAASVAQEGGQVVESVVATMDDIQRSSQRIADIISLIDGIAFQTNILSLNAAVEAARAGDQGRGFAVVASEIRTLAQRSAESAKEIKAIVDDSTAKVSQGAGLAKKAGQTMGEIVASVQNVTTIMAEISQASKEQSLGIGQVNKTIVHLDSTTQQNAALVEESAAAATSMASQAVDLSSAIAAFQVEGGRAPAFDVLPAHPNWRR